MRDRIVKSKYFSIFGELFLPVLTWIIILLPIWLSPFHPAVVAYIIIAYDLYFLYKSLLTSYYATLSYTLIQAHRDIPFSKMVKEMTDSKDIQHFVIIPNYKEPLHKLQSTVEALTRSDYPLKSIYLVLAFEKREAEAKEKAETIIAEYGSFFADVIITQHELRSHEAPGKASNQTFAAKYIETYCEKNNFDLEKSMITICDADSILPPNFFSYLTCEFLKDADRKYHFYWAPVLLYNNFWQLPFFVRMQATLSSILRLAFLSQKDQLIHVSTYATNLWLLKQIGYWDVDIIPEDWHIYFQAFFTFGEKVRTLPLYTIVNGDAVYSGSIIKTMLNRYEQEKRWAWGATDVSYCWNRMFHTPHIPMWTKMKKFLLITETHLLWPTSFFLLTVSGMVPPIVNPVFKRTVLGFLLPKLSGFILTVASAMLVLYVYLDIRLRQKLNIKTNMINVPFLLIQWYLLPVVSFFLSSLPALDAHTRILLRKKIVYKVTEKV